MPEMKVSKLLKCTKTSRSIGLSYLSDAVFTDGTLWVSGWDVRKKSTHIPMFISLNPKDFEVKEKIDIELIKDMQKKSNFKYPIVTFIGESLNFALKGGHEIASFNTKSHAFRVKYRNTNQAIAIVAMEYRNDDLYILDQNDRDNILTLKIIKLTKYQQVNIIM